MELADSEAPPGARADKRRLKRRSCEEAGACTHDRDSSVCSFDFGGDCSVAGDGVREVDGAGRGLGEGVGGRRLHSLLLWPGLIYELFMGGILYSIFIPVLVDRITRYGEEDARLLTNALFTLVLPLMLILSLVGIVFAEPLVGLVTNWQSAGISLGKRSERSRGSRCSFSGSSSCRCSFTE